MGLLHILAVTLYFDIQPYEADSTFCAPDLTRIERIAKVRLFGAPRYSSGMPHFIRERSAHAGPDTLIVDDGAPGWSYWICVSDSAGNQTPLGCCPGISVGIPLGVEGQPGEAGERYFDLAGRRLPSKPTSSGLYWLKRPGQRAKLIRIM